MRLLAQLALSSASPQRFPYGLLFFASSQSVPSATRRDGSKFLRLGARHRGAAFASLSSDICCVCGWGRSTPNSPKPEDPFGDEERQPNQHSSIPDGFDSVVNLGRLHPRRRPPLSLPCLCIVGSSRRRETRGAAIAIDRRVSFISIGRQL